jgi:hypothetical protein
MTTLTNIMANTISQKMMPVRMPTPKLAHGRIFRVSPLPLSSRG